MKKMPVLFVGHGNPMNALDKNSPFNQNFRQTTQTFEKPKAILMISAHWYSSRLQVTSGENPPMIYDFYGFPEELSQMQYPAQGSPELAEKVRSLLAPESVEMNPTRGFDHGAWMVLKYLYPDADVPVVQLSINRLQPAEWHFALAKNLLRCVMKACSLSAAATLCIICARSAGNTSTKSGRATIGRLPSVMKSTKPLARKTMICWCITGNWAKTPNLPCRRPTIICHCFM